MSKNKTYSDLHPDEYPNHRIVVTEAVYEALRDNSLNPLCKFLDDSSTMNESAELNITVTIFKPCGGKAVISSISKLKSV